MRFALFTRSERRSQPIRPAPAVAAKPASMGCRLYRLLHDRQQLRQSLRRRHRKRRYDAGHQRHHRRQSSVATAGDGGGLYAGTGSTTLDNTIVAESTVNTGANPAPADDIAGTVSR